MRNLNHASAVSNEWLARHNDVLISGMVKLRAGTPCYPRFAAKPARVKHSTCLRGRQTCLALQQRSSCLAIPANAGHEQPALRCTEMPGSHRSMSSA